MRTIICIWASGSGSNAERIIEYFQNHNSISVGLILVSHRHAGVIQRTIKLHIPHIVISRSQMLEPKFMIPLLHNHKININILAGFIWKIPNYLLKLGQPVINIHPSLLPKYGGKGMYGKHVHKAVLANGDTTSGVTIHYVNDVYDEGEIIAQYKVEVASNDTVETLSNKIHAVEHQYYPPTIEKIIFEHHG